jgi:hypothetical protein
MIEVLAVRRVENTGNIRAFVSLRIGELRRLHVRRRRQLEAAGRLHGVGRRQ